MSWFRMAGERLEDALSSPSGALGMLGRLAAGSALTSANLASRGMHLGVRAGARALGAAAATVEGTVPGAGLTRRFAGVVDQQTTTAAVASSQLAAEGMARMKGAEGGNGKPAPATDSSTTRSWTELAVDTAIGPMSRVAELSIALGSDTVREVAGTRPGRAVLDAGLRQLEARSNRVAGHFELDELRASLVTVTTDSGAAAVNEAVKLAEAMARLAFSDTRRMRRILEEGLEEMRRLATTAEMQDLLPTPMVSESVQERARLIVDRAPRHFLATLEESSGRRHDFATLLEAAFRDAPRLRVFLVLYPQVVTLAGTDVVRLLIAGELSVSELEAFLEGRRSGSDSRPADTP